MSTPRRPPWLLLSRDQIVLYALGLLVVGMSAARLACTRWGGGRDVRKLEPDDRVDYRVDINTADAGELDILPGIGPAKARRIIEHREANGPFAAVDDLARVSGISHDAVVKLRDLVTVGDAAARGTPPE